MAAPSVLGKYPTRHGRHGRADLHVLPSAVPEMGLRTSTFALGISNEHGAQVSNGALAINTVCFRVSNAPRLWFRPDSI